MDSSYWNRTDMNVWNQHHIFKNRGKRFHRPSRFTRDHNVLLIKLSMEVKLFSFIILFLSNTKFFRNLKKFFASRLIISVNYLKKRFNLMLQDEPIPNELLKELLVFVLNRVRFRYEIEVPWEMLQDCEMTIGLHRVVLAMFFHYIRALSEPRQVNCMRK